MVYLLSFHDQNDINESTRNQLDATSTALAELQSKELRQGSKRRIEFLQDRKVENTSPIKVGMVSVTANFFYFFFVKSNFLFIFAIGLGEKS